MGNLNGILLIIFLNAIVRFFNFVHADLPIHALYLDVIGEWKAYISKSVSGDARYCGATRDVSKTDSQILIHPSDYIRDTYGLEEVILFKLTFQPVVLDFYQSNRNGWIKFAVLNVVGKTIGFWTAVYNIGFEIILYNDASLFFYLDYEKVGNMKYMTHADSAKIGWSTHYDAEGHFVYRCASAVKRRESSTRRFVIFDPFKMLHYRSGPNRLRRRIAKMTRKIRRVYNTSAGMYPCGCGRNGGLRIYGLQVRFLWQIFKNVPVPNDGECKRSYYSAVIQVVQAKMLDIGMSEALHIDACANDIYNQRCNGGDPYLVGKMGKELGFDMRNSSGEKMKARVYLDGYGYLGGCYQCTKCKGEEAIMREIYNNGPVVAMIDSNALPRSISQNDIVGIPQLKRKDHGICELERFILSGWEPTNHAIVLYGWGEVRHAGNNVKVWYARNSWGKDWGRSGDFKIIRGVNYFGVESRVLYFDIHEDPAERSRPTSYRNSRII